MVTVGSWLAEAAAWTHGAIRPVSLELTGRVAESRRPCPRASATPQQAEWGEPMAGLPW